MIKSSFLAKFSKGFWDLLSLCSDFLLHALPRRFRTILCPICTLPILHHLYFFSKPPLRTSNRIPLSSTICIVLGKATSPLLVNFIYLLAIHPELSPNYPPPITSKSSLTKRIVPQTECRYHPQSGQCPAEPPVLSSVAQLILAACWQHHTSWLAMRSCWLAGTGPLSRPEIYHKLDISSSLFKSI